MLQRWICLRTADTLHIRRKGLGIRRFICAPSTRMSRSLFREQKMEQLRSFHLTEIGLDLLQTENLRRCLCEADLRSQSAIFRTRRKQVGAGMVSSCFDQSTVLDCR